MSGQARKPAERGCQAKIAPSWANGWVTCGYVVRNGKCVKYGHEQPPEPSAVTVQAPDVAALRSALRRVADVLDFADDAIDPPITTEIDTNIVRMALLDTEDAPPAELRRQVRALLGTDTTTGSAS